MVQCNSENLFFASSMSMVTSLHRSYCCFVFCFYLQNYPYSTIIVPAQNMAGAACMVGACGQPASVDQFAPLTVYIQYLLYGSNSEPNKFLPTQHFHKL